MKAKCLESSFLEMIFWKVLNLEPEVMADIPNPFWTDIIIRLAAVLIQYSLAAQNKNYVSRQWKPNRSLKV